MVSSSSREAADAGLRRLEPKDLTPSCELDAFSIKYFVEVLASVISHLTHLPPDPQQGTKWGSLKVEEVLSSQPVRLATLFASGEPIPRPFTKPVRVRRNRSGCI
ncbi:unnamed protein product [Cyclocybe aegerita]|uniref:Uncharacterized protein n=1 Tax=Cyclocybe aegerita TaxID=1973307 RepID=A0A8S0VRK4_CYCAE|nr:unnamed protein product [Cyclocybe aegerita]